MISCINYNKINNFSSAVFPVCSVLQMICNVVLYTHQEATGELYLGNQASLIRAPVYES